MATVFKQKTWLDLCIERGSKEFFSTAVNLTPDLAADLLARNPANRSINQARLDLYCADMLAGNWAFNGEPIIISNDGRITNGQHRCASVVKTGVTILTAIAFGVDFETRKTTDQLRPKHAGDFAGMDGIPNAQGIAAIAGMAAAFDQTGSINKRGMTPTQILQYINQNQEALEFSASYAHARVTRLKNVAPASIVGFCHFVTRRINKEAADEYISQIVTGEGLGLTDPAMVVRNRLISLGRASRAIKAEVILHGWNAFRRGQSRTSVKVLGKIPELV